MKKNIRGDTRFFFDRHEKKHKGNTVIFFSSIVMKKNISGNTCFFCDGHLNVPAQPAHPPPVQGEDGQVVQAH